MNDLESKFEEFMDIIINSYIDTDRTEILKRLRKQMRPEAWKTIYGVIENEKKLTGEQIRRRAIDKAERDLENRRKIRIQKAYEDNIKREKEIKRSYERAKRIKLEEDLAKENVPLEIKEKDRVETNAEFHERIRQEADRILARQK